jgi:hypothetical protein
MCFSGEMNYGVYFVSIEKLIHQRAIANIPFYECMPFGKWYILKIFIATSVREHIQIDHLDIRLSIK